MMDRSARSTAYINIKTQFENVGDALINRELVRAFAQEVHVVANLSRCEPVFVGTIALDQVPNVELVDSTIQLVVRMLKDRFRARRVYYLLNPGGYFGELTRRQSVAALVSTLALACCRLIGVRLCRLGVSYERLGPRHLRIAQARSRLLFRHVVRDHVSADYCRRRNIKITGVMPDLSLHAAPTKIGDVRDRTSIGLSFRSDQQERQYADIERVVLRLDGELPADRRFVFIAQVKRDIATMRRLAGKIADRGARSCEVVECYDDIERCFEMHAECAYIVSNRLHSLFMGILTGSVPVGIGGEGEGFVKIKGALAFIGAADNVCELENGECPQVCDGILSGKFARIDVTALRRRVGDAIREIVEA